MSIWDVAMNVHGADVERRLRRTVMPRFHAAFSLGTAVGALVAASAAAAGVGLATQLTITAPLVAAVAIVAVRRFLPMGRGPAPEPGGHRISLDAWRESRTRVIGAVDFGFALIEGVANDWLALAVADGLSVSQCLGSLAFAVFAIAMTTTRLSGAPFVERYGPVIALRASAALAAGGTLLVIMAPSIATAVGGAALWGMGAALGFPVALSAAAAGDPASAAARVSVVSTIGYTAFLAGPPFVGTLADAVGVQRALLVVLVAAGLALLSASSTTPRQPGPARATPTDRRAAIRAPGRDPSRGFADGAAPAGIASPMRSIPLIVFVVHVRRTAHRTTPTERRRTMTNLEPVNPVNLDQYGHDALSWSAVV
ncbi:MAG: hypothetical protein ACREXP_29950, partial [Steroidobacteraceae bacterium]